MVMNSTIPSKNITDKTLAAKDFVTSYYATLNGSKGHTSLMSFYLKPTEARPLKPQISMNGKVLPDPAALQSAIADQPERHHYIHGGKILSKSKAGT